MAENAHGLDPHPSPLPHERETEGLRVLFVINGLGTGGAERSLAEMLPRLVDQGIDLTVACFYRREEGVEEILLSRGSDIRFLGSPHLAGRVRSLRRLLQETRPHLLHTTLFEADLAGRLAAIGTGVPVLTSLVNTTYDPARLADPRVKRLRLEVVRLLDRWTSRHLTTHFHAVSHAVKDAACQALGIEPERITVIERGRDPARLGEPNPKRRHRVRAALGLTEEQPVVITVGRQEYQKGQRYLLEAIGMVAGHRPDLRLLLVGRRGNASEDLELLLAKPEIGEHVEVLGHREDVPDLLAAADVFAFPSMYEGLGGAVVEAMALGMPVVAADLPVMREVLEPDGNALLVRPGSAEDLAGALEHLLAHPEKAQAFSRRSRQIFQARFTFQRSLERTAQLYRRLGERTGA
ncbi:MAG: glycosyltransferase [Actinomycetota bacterium]|nr:glycosyltransferase [Actinomycetota bacterium]